MKIALTAVSAAFLALPAAAQTAPPASGQTAPAATSSLTRDLNSGPPAAATYLAPAPSAAPGVRPATPTPAPTPSAPRPAPATATPAPAAATARAASGPSPSAPRPAPSAPAASPAPSSAPAPRPATTAAPAPRPTAAPATATAAEPAPAAAPSAYTVLDAAARAALPFTIDLPAGFELGAGRPGPDFTIYSVRKGGVPYVMIYAGPASQFPIYDGQMVEAAGRASVVVAEGGVRHAMEHLFQRGTAPREIHIWVSSLDAAEQAAAEAIAQSVDVR